MDDAYDSASAVGPVPAGPAITLVEFMNCWADQIQGEMDRRRADQAAEVARFLAWKAENADAIAAAAPRPRGPARAPF